jgi:environmental stress-induced protein Ves
MLEVRRAHEHVVSRWRNGGGRTTEVLAWPPGAGADEEFDWRVSFADVAGSGDFSLFPGVDRVIVLVEGASMTLQVGTRTEQLEPYQPLAFDGGVPVSCSVSAPTRDLNVMTRRGRATASVDVLDRREDDPALALAGGQPLLVVALTGELAVTAGSERERLRAGDVLVTREAVTVSGAGRCAVVRIGQRPPW